MALSSLLSRCVPGLALLAPLLGGSAPERADGALPPASEGVEHFVLAWTGEGPVPGPAGPKRAAARRDGIVGFARMRRHRGAAGVQLELELEWPAEDLRVYAVERLREGAARLVWREMGPGRGRTLRAEWAPDGASLETAAWDHGGRRARSASLDEGGVLPQYLVELARSGRAVGGRFRVFDPLSGGFEERELTTCYEAAGGPEGGPLE